MSGKRYLNIIPRGLNFSVLRRLEGTTGDCTSYEEWRCGCQYRYCYGSNEYRPCKNHAGQECPSILRICEWPLGYPDIANWTYFRYTTDHLTELTVVVYAEAEKRGEKVEQGDGNLIIAAQKYGIDVTLGKQAIPFPYEEQGE